MSVQVIAEFWLGTGNRKARNSCPLMLTQSYIILAYPRPSSFTPCLEYHGLCLLRRSFLDLEIEACRTRTVAFPSHAPRNHSEAGDFCNY